MASEGVRFVLPVDAEPIRAGGVGRPPLVDRVRVAEMHANGLTRREIALQLRSSYWSVCRALNDHPTERTIPPVAAPELDPKYLCQCGCGSEINPRVRQVDELFARGFRAMQIARELGIDKAAVRQFRVDPPRFLKGHFGKAPKPMVECANPNCKRIFRKMGPNHLYCTHSSKGWTPNDRTECGRLAFEHKQRLWKELDEDVGGRMAARVIAAETRKARIVTATMNEVVALGGDYETVAVLARKAVTEGRWKPRRLVYPHAQETLDRLVSSHRQRVESDIERATLSLIEQTRWRVKGRRTSEATVRHAVANSAELAELVEEQRKDMRFGDRMPKWVLSLDRKIGDGTSVLRDLIPDTGPDPFDTLVGQEILREVGLRDLDEIDSLDDRTRQWLQEKLVACGLVTAPLVADKDRKLWLPSTTKTHSVQVDQMVEAVSLGGIEPEAYYDDTHQVDPHAQMTTMFGANRLVREFRRRERAHLKRQRRLEKRLQHA